MLASSRNNVQVHGTGGRAIVFGGMDPAIAKEFARADLPGAAVPTPILRCAEDFIAPDAVGAYVHRQIAGSTLVRLDATGHCPNLSAPDGVVKAIRAHV